MVLELDRFIGQEKKKRYGRMEGLTNEVTTSLLELLFEAKNEMLPWQILSMLIY